MYVRKDVLKQVIALFTDMPKFRDDRFETIRFIVTAYHSAYYGKDIIVDFKLTSDIDRAFRLVQSEMPKLRGETYWDRQRQGGEISEAEYAEIKSMRDQISELSKQLNLFKTE